MIEHAEINFALIRERLNQGDRRWGDGQVAARMRLPRSVYGLALIDAVDDAYVGSAFDESPDADRELGLAILATHQQMGLAIARWQRRRDQRAVIEGGFFVVDHPRRTRAGLALRRPARRVRGGGIEAVVAFQSLAIVLDLTARLEGVLGLGAGGKENAGASDGQYGAHGRIRADRVPACKTRVKPVYAARSRVARLAPSAAYRANAECVERSQAVGRTKGKAAPGQKAKAEDQRLSVLATRKPSVSNRTLTWRLTRAAARTRSLSLRQEPPRTIRKLGSPPASHADPSVGAPS